MSDEFLTLVDDYMLDLLLDYHWGVLSSGNLAEEEYDTYLDLYNMLKKEHNERRGV